MGGIYTGFGIKSPTKDEMSFNQINTRKTLDFYADL